MDSVNKCSDESSWRWTNERHLNFLNSMENTFVRTMLENTSITPNSGLPLDRYLPDTCESTLDLQKPRRRRYSTSDILERRSEKKTKKQLVSRPFIITAEDQVVPNGNRRGGGGSGRPEEKSNRTRVDEDVDATSSE